MDLISTCGLLLAECHLHAPKILSQDRCNGLSCEMSSSFFLKNQLSNFLIDVFKWIHIKVVGLCLFLIRLENLCSHNRPLFTSLRVDKNIFHSFTGPYRIQGNCLLPRFPFLVSMDSKQKERPVLSEFCGCWCFEDHSNRPYGSTA